MSSTNNNNSGSVETPKVSNTSNWVYVYWIGGFGITIYISYYLNKNNNQIASILIF